MPLENRSNPPNDVGNASKPMTEALRRQAAIQKERQTFPQRMRDQTRSLLLGGKEEVLSPERKFSAVVMGHPYAEFDLDQFISYYLALKSGIVDSSASVEFTNTVDQAHFTNDSTLVLEGFSHPLSASEQEVRQAKKDGNFTNDPTTNAPAAEAFFQQFTRSFHRNLPMREELFDLRYWINGQENELPGNEIRNKISVVQPKALDAFIPIFYALHHKYRVDTPQNQSAFIFEAASALEKLLQIKQADSDWREKLNKVISEYSQALEAYTPIQEDRDLRLNERLSNPDFFQNVTTMTGISLTFFDIRGLDIDKGGMTAALQAVDTDILMLVDDHVNPRNTNEVAGLSVKFRLGDTHGGDINLLDLLAERLNLSEELYGRGFIYTQQGGFGGHPGIIGSPQAEGTDINPKALWSALQNFFDYPRFNREQFSQKANDVAQKANIETFSIVPLQPPESPYALSSYEMLLQIQSAEGALEQVRIKESDISLYEAALTGSPEDNLILLQEKTRVSEPAAITVGRQEFLLPHLQRYTRERKVERMLMILEELNYPGVQSLPGELQVEIIEAIASDPQAIDAVWNKNNTRFRILDERLPEQVKIWMENYKLSRYKLRSLAHTVDHILLRSSRDFVFGAKDPDSIRHYGETLLSILNSETYKSSHIEASYDTLLEQTLYYLNQLRGVYPPLAEELIDQLLKKYGGMDAHWQSVDSTYLTPLATAYPEKFAPIIEKIRDTNINAENIPGIAGSRIDRPDLEKISAEFESGTRSDSHITLLIEVQRPIKAAVEQTDFVTLNGQKVRVIPEGYIHTPALDLDEAQEHLKVIKAAEDIVSGLLPILEQYQDAKIRIIQGGFINRLSRQMQSAIEKLIRNHLLEKHSPSDNETLMKALDEADLYMDRIVWSDYDLSKLQYQDAPFIE